MTPDGPLPESTWQVVGLLRARVPSLEWNPGRIALAISDNPLPDPLVVAGRAADWIAFQARNVTDGPATFRRFLERAEPSLTPKDLSAYDRFQN